MIRGEAIWWARSDFLRSTVPKWTQKMKYIPGNTHTLIPGRTIQSSYFHQQIMFTSDRKNSIKGVWTHKRKNLTEWHPPNKICNYIWLSVPALSFSVDVDECSRAANTSLTQVLAHTNVMGCSERISSCLTSFLDVFWLPEIC